MADKTKAEAIAAKRFTSKRPSSVNVAASRTKVLPKEKAPPRPKKANPDTTILKQEQISPELDEDRQIVYGRFLRDMLEECLIDEKIEREEAPIELQMAQLAERFRKTTDQLDKTNRRLKDISFVVEQKRLLDLKTNETAQFYNMTENSNAETLLQDLSATEQQHLDKIELRNVDFGYNTDTGHKQLLDAVNDAIDGLEKIKKDSNLDTHKFQEYERSKQDIEEINKDRMDLESLKTVFESEFPRISERLLQEASEKIARLIENDDGDSDEEVDD